MWDFTRQISGSEPLPSAVFQAVSSLQGGWLELEAANKTLLLAALGGSLLDKGLTRSVENRTKFESRSTFKSSKFCWTFIEGMGFHVLLRYSAME